MFLFLWNPIKNRCHLSSTKNRGPDATANRDRDFICKKASKRTRHHSRSICSSTELDRVFTSWRVHWLQKPTWIRTLMTPSLTLQINQVHAARHSHVDLVEIKKCQLMNLLLANNDFNKSEQIWTSFLATMRQGKTVEWVLKRFGTDVGERQLLSVDWWIPVRTKAKPREIRRRLRSSKVGKYILMKQRAAKQSCTRRCMAGPIVWSPMVK